MKSVCRLLFIFTVLMAEATCALADGLSVEDRLLSKMDTARHDETKRAKKELALLEREATARTSPGESKDPHEKILSLLHLVENLKAKAVVREQQALNRVTPNGRQQIGAITVYPYQDGKLYDVHTGVNTITDIQLEPGETLKSSPVAGDTVRWKIGLITSGSAPIEQQHIVVKPLEAQISTNLVLSTDRRIYHLSLRADTWHMPAVRWSYPQQELTQQVQVAKPRAKKGACELNVGIETVNFDYHIEASKRVKWKPVAVYDDGAKTYIKMPARLKTTEAPALFIVSRDSEDVQLVNYRLRCNHFIVDRLFEHAELRVGKSERVEIFGAEYEPSFWDRIF